jgi:hypothetical protein
MMVRGVCPGTSHGQTPVLKMAGRTRAIVRLEGWNRVVTKGYQKGVYERVTKGIKVLPVLKGRSSHRKRGADSMDGLFDDDPHTCTLPVPIFEIFVRGELPT